MDYLQGECSIVKSVKVAGNFRCRQRIFTLTSARHGPAADNSGYHEGNWENHEQS
jgi:hypothetical protein